MHLSNEALNIEGISETGLTVNGNVTLINESKLMSKFEFNCDLIDCK